MTEGIGDEFSASLADIGSEEFAELMRDPTRCYATGCEEENELLLHMSDNPTGFADLCLPHAEIVVKTSPLILTCDCVFCVRARKQFMPHLDGE